MKALFLLRKLKKRCLDFDYDTLCDEAISELEALQQHIKELEDKTCVRCGKDFGKLCHKCEEAIKNTK